MKRYSLFVVSLIVALLPLVGARPAAAAANADQLPESVQVTGQGKVSAKPDTLEAAFAVETNAPTVNEALKRAGAAAARMRDMILRGGVARADVQTSTVTVNATRKDDGAVTGYAVSQGLTVKFRDLAGAGTVISTAVTAGGDAARISGMSFAIEDDTKLLAEARRKAFADARGKAELYAREAGRPLGRVIRVSEGGPSFWGPAGQDRFAAADSSVPIEPGRQQLTVTVTVEWALDTAVR